MKANLKIFLYSLIIILGFFVLWEGVLVFSGFPAKPFRSIIFGGDPNSTLLFEESPRLWWKLRKKAEVTFLGTPVTVGSEGLRAGSTDEEEGDEFRIYCLGGSSTFGWRIPFKQTYPFLLETKLKEKDAVVRVVNGGVPGYTSFQTLGQLRELIDKNKPNLVIIYSSNKEPSLGGDSDKERYRSEESMRGFREFFSQFVWFQFLKDKMVSPEPFKPSGEVSLKRLLRMSPRVRLSDYRENLVKMVDLARNNNIHIFLATVPNNIFEPYFFELPPMDPKVNRLIKLAEEQIEAGEYEIALGTLESAQNQAGDFYKIYFLRGKIFRSTGREGVIEEYEKALERHPFPERLKPSYNSALVQVGKELDVPVIDLYHSVMDSPMGYENLFIDAAHLSAAGHEVVSDLLASTILEEL